MIGTSNKKRILFAIFLFCAVPNVVFAGYIRPIVFPVQGGGTFIDDFGDGRSGGREHEANDIMAPKMTHVISATDGVVSYIVKPEASWGYAVVVRDSEGWEYWYLHLNNDTPGTDNGQGGLEYAYAPGIDRGTRVTAGQHLGYVGDSGNAESTAPHLHFEIRRPDGTAINPYESLLAATHTVPGPANETLNTVVIIPRDGILVKYSNSPKVYIVKNGIKQHIADEESFLALNFSWNTIQIIPDSESYRTGVPIAIGSGSVAQYEDGTSIVLHVGDTSSSRNSYFFTSDLALGSRGAEVSELQKLLKELSFFNYPSITGYFGQVTRDAVIAFQRSRGISPVGIVGPETRAALNSL